MQTADLAKEWLVLQNQFDSYEKYSLMIKLLGVAMLGLAYSLNHLGGFLLWLLAILWLQDAIWKTFQSRIDTRLLQVERFLSSGQKLAYIDGKAYQYNTLYAQERPSTGMLIWHYLRQALRPTVAFPYAPLMLVLGLKLLWPTVF